jgi:hypothetical protein
MLQQVGRTMIVVGLVVAALGVGLWALGRLGVARLPGDFSLAGKGWRVYLPIGTCVLVSVVLSLLMWALSRFHRE